ncbi:hypothetical protein PT974_09724 [Cladobotryum mycophilum]|uniref:Uncharacterized protein n=1 Tax=Cladobotryum mycophilum TaxID=491253 RepID=A0ABR0SHX2_9HYPO
MKFLLPVTCLAVGAMAQGIAVGHPAPGSTLHTGKNVVVQVIRYNFIQSATEVGVAIGLVPCPNSSCPAPEGIIGDVLHTGPYNPQFHGPGQQYQNFTVQVPEGFPAGPAAINVARFFLIGAGSSPTIGGASVSVNIKD